MVGVTTPLLYSQIHTFPSNNCRIPVSDHEVAVCSLPGNRMGGSRRSLVADLGKRFFYCSGK